MPWDSAASGVVLGGCSVQVLLLSLTFGTASFSGHSVQAAALHLTATNGRDSNRLD